MDETFECSDANTRPISSVKLERSRLADQVAEPKSTSSAQAKALDRERKGASVHTVIASSRTRGAVRGEPARLGASLEEGQDPRESLKGVLLGPHMKGLQMRAFRCLGWRSHSVVGRAGA